MSGVSGDSNNFAYLKEEPFVSSFCARSSTDTRTLETQTQLSLAEDQDNLANR
jgi:hypothetical protein